MCGIVGILNMAKDRRGGVNSKILDKMNNLLSHRGPDEGRVVLPEEFIGLGHRRLSVIDLSKYASQPMCTKDGRYTLVYNGELYNYREIRKQLITLGYSFRSSSDTEVVLQSYAEWGEDAFLKFNGMFALAIYDKKMRSLILARDRYGIKPLYYCTMGNSFLFASEQKAFFAFPEFKKKLDLTALKEYFTFQNIFTNKTFYQGVKLLQAGSYMTVSAMHDGSSRIRQYWDFDFNESDEIKNTAEYVEELEYLFKKAVNRQLISDVPVGSYLSGGLDSGAITAIASKSIPYIKSFTCGFDLHSVTGLEQGFDEREKAEHLSYHCKSEHYEVVLKAGDMEKAMKELVWHVEEPRVGQSYPNYYASFLASKFVKVILSGAGGDELFGGYPWRYYRSVTNQSFDEYVDKYYEFWQRLVPANLVEPFFSPISDEIKEVDTRQIFSDVFRKDRKHLISPEQCINHSLYFEAKTFLHGLLIIEDKISMAHGLETRVPFLDNDLVDFAMKIPVNMKLLNLNNIIRINENDTGVKPERYFQKTKDGKIILRKAMKKIIPEETLKGIKQGFSAPDASWYRKDSRDYVGDILENSQSPIYDYLEQKIIKRLIEEHFTGKENRRLLIWSLLYFDEWCKAFL